MGEGILGQPNPDQTKTHVENDGVVSSSGLASSNEVARGQVNLARSVTDPEAKLGFKHSGPYDSRT
jgi:hypothetical protein